MKNARLPFGWLTYLKSTKKTTTSIKGAPRPLHRRSIARSTTTSQSTFDFRSGWRYADRRGRRGYFHVRPVHGGGAGRTADQNMSGEECAVRQRIDTACRPKEAAAPPH